MFGTGGAKQMDHVTAEQLHSNAVLGGIVHATSQIHSDAMDVIWEGNECWLEDFVDTAGVLRFLPVEVVGVFCDVECPYPRSWLAKNQEHLFRGMPADLRGIAEEFIRTHPHMQLPLGGEELSLASAVLWSEGGRLRTAVPWPEFLENGGHILRDHLVPPENALAVWAETYRLSADETAFVQRVFERKRAAGFGTIALTTDEWRWLGEEAHKAERPGPYGNYFAGLEICWPGMPIGIGWPSMPKGSAEPGAAPDQAT
ncbi:MAG TPA: hypothetical protein VGE74_02870 [Gemmata sp.]